MAVEKNGCESSRFQIWYKMAMNHPDHPSSELKEGFHHNNNDLEESSNCNDVEKGNSSFYS